MKIDNTIPPYQPTRSRITSPSGSFAEQLQQLTQTQGNNADPRTQKMREITGKYDLDRLSFNQCAEMVNELCASGIVDMHEAAMLVPWEKMVAPDGSNRSKEELDNLIVDPRKEMEIVRDRARWEGDQDKALFAQKILKTYDELLATFHEIKGKPQTLSTRA